VMRAWGADGIEMEDGNDFITIVCFSLRKIATEGAGIGRIFSCLKLVYCTLFIFIFYFIFYSSIHFETKKKKGRKKSYLFPNRKVEPAPTGILGMPVIIENLFLLIPSKPYGDKGYGPTRAFCKLIKEIPHPE